MRVLTVLDAFRLGGAETLIAQMGRVAAVMGLEMEVLSLHGYSEERSKLAPMLERAGLEPHYLGAERTVDPAAFGRLVRYIKNSSAELVHAHLEMAMTQAMPAATLAGKPSLGTFHHVYRPLTGRAAGRERLAVEVATRSQAAIFVSQASLTSFADRYRPHRPIPKTWRVVHNGIDLDYFSPPTDAEVARLPSDLDLGPVPCGHRARRATRLQGHHPRHPRMAGGRRAPSGCPVAAGRIGERGGRRCAPRSRRLDLADTVVFAGMRSDVPDVLRGSEMVVLPSIYGENLPTVLMEAGGCGRPVIASDVGGISDIVAAGETGLLVPPGDEAGLDRSDARTAGRP